MAQAAARLLFVVVVVLNVLLWSSSRFNQPVAVSSLLAKDGTLMRRVSYELMHPGEVSTVDDQCHPISIPSALQCAHVESNCESRSTFLSLDYLHFYYCSEIPLRPLSFIALVTWLIFLFSTLGISASDFFTPNLASIAQLLGLDENVAGVTFLAFGNGSPDLFSTLSAMRAGSGSLAIGELLGAASFIVSCVVGSMCIIKPFRVHKGPFLRDVGFFTIAVGLVLVILEDGKIVLGEAGLLVGLYGVYVAIVVIGSWWDRKREIRRLREEVVRGEYNEDGQVFPPYSDEYSPSTTTSNFLDVVNHQSPQRTRATSNPMVPRIQTTFPSPSPNTNIHTTTTTKPNKSRSRSPSPNSRIPSLPSFSLVGAVEFRDVIADLKNESSANKLSMFETPVTPFAGGHYHTHARLRTRTRSRAHSIAGVSPKSSKSGGGIGDEENLRMSRSLHLDATTTTTATITRLPLSPLISDGNGTEGASGSSSGGGDYFSGHHHTTGISQSPSHGIGIGGGIISIPSIYRTPASPSQHQQLEPLYVSIPTTKRQNVWKVLGEVLHTLFPTMHRIREHSILGKIVAVLAAPAVMGLTLTLPVVVMSYDSKKHSVVSYDDDGIHGLDDLDYRDRDRGREVCVEEGRLVNLDDGIDTDRDRDEDMDMDMDEDEDRDNEEMVLVAEREVEETMHHKLTFSKWLMAVQCFCGPLFCAGVLFRDTKYELWILLVTAVIGFTVGVLVFVFARDDGLGSSSMMVRCSMGFLVSMVWIMAIADEVVSVLQTFGTVFGLSDAIIGLTIFAVGNSLADLVANMSVAVFAPIMGFSACFGGPMLNILLGIGLSGSFIIHTTNQPYLITLSTTLLVSAIGLLILLGTTLIWVPWNDYYLSRKWGVVLVGFYLVIMVINIVVEVRGFDS